MGLPSGYLSLYALTNGACLVEFPNIINIVTPTGMECILPTTSNC